MDGLAHRRTADLKVVFLLQRGSSDRRVSSIASGETPKPALSRSRTCRTMRLMHRTLESRVPECAGESWKLMSLQLVLQFRF